MHDLKVWLSYVSYPITTAAYLERALRRVCHTTTIGPTLPHEKAVEWQLEALKLPFKDQEICTGFKPDMGKVLADTDPACHPDLYLWVESVGGHYPQNLAALTCTKACYLIDTHMRLADLIEWSHQFDCVFVAQLAHVAAFRKEGINAHWLPLACDPDIHQGPVEEKEFDIAFVGSIYKDSRRKHLLDQLNQQGFFRKMHLPLIRKDQSVQLISLER